MYYGNQLFTYCYFIVILLLFNCTWQVVREEEGYLPLQTAQLLPGSDPLPDQFQSQKQAYTKIFFSPLYHLDPRGLRPLH